MFDRIKKWLAPELYNIPDLNSGVADVPQNNEKKQKKKEPSPKEKANLAGEPYISVVRIDLDPNDINNGAFDLDWNDKFILNLIRQGYKKKDTDSDAEIVDRWFTQVCRNVALEVYEQNQADPANRDSDYRVIQQRDLGNGYTEVS